MRSIFVSFLDVFLSILILVQVVLAPFLGHILVLVIVNTASPSGFTPNAFSTSLAKTATHLCLVLALLHSKIECHYCHAKGHITSRCPQRALIFDCDNDSLLEDTDELLVMDILEPDYDKDYSVMYEDDYPPDEDSFRDEMHFVHPQL